MCEPPWRTELAQIQKDEEVRYIATVFTWFHRWRIRSGAWPLLPQSEFSLSKEMRDRVNSHLVPTLAKVEMLMGEMQALKALISLQCIAEAGPRRPTPGYVCQCIESIMHPISYTSEEEQVNPIHRTSEEERHYGTICGSALATQIALRHSRAQTNPAVERGPNCKIRIKKLPKDKAEDKSTQTSKETKQSDL